MAIVCFLVLTLLVFWIVGARNRLMQLRHQLFGAFGPLEQQLRKRHALGRLLADSAKTMADVPREQVEAVLASQTQAAELLQAMRPRPRLGPSLARVGTAEEVYGQALAQLSASLPASASDDDDITIEGSPTMPMPLAPADASAYEWRHRLRQLHAPLDYARQRYNGSALAYNAALRQVPTTLVAALFRLTQAPVLPRISTPD